MWHRLRNVWRPENFHYAHKLARGADRFEGWYFKIVDPEGRHPFAIIPGVFLGEDAHAFVQVLDGRRGRSWYHRYPLSDFAASRSRFEVRIAGNRFHSRGLSLHIDPKDDAGGPAVRGRLQLGPWSRWPVTPLSPGVMGPYGFAPFMQCYHGILSLDHGVRGTLEVDDRPLDFDGGRGYLEKDWGQGFPLGYVWTQSNHFERPGIGVTASLATIPWVTGAFRGFLVGFLLDGTLHRFTTYTGARLESVEMTDSHVRLWVADRAHRLELDARKADGAVLHAPYERRMLERVAETMTSEIDLRFLETAGRRERVVFEGVGRHACLEAQGELDRVLDA
jgi:tocopherol cyclase